MLKKVFCTKQKLLSHRLNQNTLLCFREGANPNQLQSPLTRSFATARGLSAIYSAAAKIFLYCKKFFKKKIKPHFTVSL